MTSDRGDNGFPNGGFSRPDPSAPHPPPPNWQNQPPYGGPVYQQPQKKNQKTAIIVIITLGIAALVLIGVIAALLVVSSSNKAEAVFATCTEQVPGANSADLRSDGKSIQFDWGANPDTSDLQMLSCLLDETGAPSAVEARMETTRALDGTQDADWDHWSAFWTYHPDSGLNATFTAE